MIRLLAIGAVWAIAACGKPARLPAQPAPAPAAEITAPAETPADSWMTREDIDRPIKAHQEALRACYQRELARDPDLGGTVLVHFVVDAHGAVTEASIDRERTTINDDRQ